MANRSYLYSLTSQPSSFDDVPERITGLTEANYSVPFVASLLVSTHPSITASLFAPVLTHDDGTEMTKLPALCAAMAPGVERLERFLAALRAATPGNDQLHREADSALMFLAEHRRRYVQLETIELAMMSVENQADLDALIAEHRAEAVAVGEAVDALPDDTEEAGRLLADALVSGEGVFSVFRGLPLDDQRGPDNQPLGLSYWSTNLYWSLRGTAERQADQ
ncbi:MAG TPA: hypothetical protein H9902_01915 [Candidatus Stackebrandtia faecavium]|nr:hypothetical protein [Candidatus Stackebrandtia faecavium]